MQNNSQKFGAEGEEWAVGFLKKEGYQILERNWRFKKLEIDIIARKGDVLVIVEVKTRKNDTFGQPEIFVTKRKQQFLITAAHYYITERDLDLETRFDIVAISSQGEQHTVKHLEGAFYPTAQ
jgi:putative endonuclease